MLLIRSLLHAVWLDLDGKQSPKVNTLVWKPSYLAVLILWWC
jgi:hypothetical protein